MLTWSKIRNDWPVFFFSLEKGDGLGWGSTCPEEKSCFDKMAFLENSGL